MFRREVYEAVVEAKGIVAGMLELEEVYEGTPCGKTVCELICEEKTREEMLEIVRRFFFTAPTMRLRVALFTVLAAGAFTEEGAFYMPGTRACLETYGTVKKALKHRKRLELFMYEYGGEGRHFGVRIL